MNLVIIDDKRTKIIMMVTSMKKLKNSINYNYMFALFISSNEGYRWDWEHGTLKFNDSITTNKIAINYPTDAIMKHIICGVFNAKL